MKNIEYKKEESMSRSSTVISGRWSRSWSWSAHEVLIIFYAAGSARAVSHVDVRQIAEEATHKQAAAAAINIKCLHAMAYRYIIFTICVTDNGSFRRR